jgi:hypothetical protein
MADLDLQELIQHSLKGTSPKAEAKVVKAEVSPQMGLFGEESEEPKKAKRESGKRQTAKAEKPVVQADMFEKDFKELKRAEEEKKAKERQKLEDRPLPKHHRMPSGGGGGGGMKPDTDITASKKLPKMAKGGSVSSASKRADGCATKGKTKGRIV